MFKTYRPRKGAYSQACWDKSHFSLRLQLFIILYSPVSRTGFDANFLLKERSRGVLVSQRLKTQI